MVQFKLRLLMSFMLAVLVISLPACKVGNAVPSQTVQPASPSAQDLPGSAAPTVTSKSLVPSPSPIPLIARIGDIAVTVEEYQAEKSLLQAAKGTELAPEDEQRLLDDLINQALLAQAALEQGFQVDDDLIEERWQLIINQAGGQAAMDQWLLQYQYTPDSFRRALSRSIAAAWMRDQIIQNVPEVAEQVHARQILLYSAEQAKQVYAQLQAGNDFGNLARRYDPLTGGDLGWFPRGLLLDPKLDEALFSLEPGQYSEIIETPAGYHILFLVERDAQRPLEPQALDILRNQALLQWLQTRRSQMNIELFTP